MYKGFTAKAIGYSHEKNGKPCQDAAGYKADNGHAIVAVSDGHGSEKYFRSEIGSDIAVKVALGCLSNFLENHRASLTDAKERDNRLQDIARHIITKWQEEIEKHFAATPLNAGELEIYNKYSIAADKTAHIYGSTLLYACITPNYSFASQLGDGACVFLKTNEPDCLPIPEDERLGFGVTTSLCDSEAIDNFRHYFSESTADVEAILLCTDGVADSYTPDSLLRFNRKIYDTMNEDGQLAKEQLQAWLPILSEKGSGDDMGIAGIYKAKTQCVEESLVVHSAFSWLSNFIPKKIL